MHVYSFYLQVNLYKRGFSFERWGSPPSDFVLPFPHFSFVVANKDDIIYAHDCSDFAQSIVIIKIKIIMQITTRRIVAK